jgi:hypothetical protein
VSTPRTIPMSAAPSVTAPTSSGNQSSPSWKSWSRATQLTAVVRTAATRLSPSTPGSASRTERSPPCAETERAIQCWSGKVSAAPAKDQ